MTKPEFRRRFSAPGVQGGSRSHNASFRGGPARATWLALERAGKRGELRCNDCREPVTLAGATLHVWRAHGRAIPVHEIRDHFAVEKGAA